jgi:hypothetical protein
MERLQQPVPGRPLATHPALSGVVGLHAGGVYAVDGLSLALTVLAGPSAAGEWGAVIGVPEFGAEAAAELGVALERTVLVPDPAGSWLEATAALADVAGLVVVRPPERVRESTAEKMRARLRRNGSALVVLCDTPALAWAAWPRADARLAAAPRWSGLGRGHGLLAERELHIQRERRAG